MDRNACVVSLGRPKADQRHTELCAVRFELHANLKSHAQKNTFECH